MPSASILIQAPKGDPSSLLLLLHGTGATPQDMLPVGQQLAAAFTDAVVVSVCAPHASDLGRGYQWFSVLGVTEDSRPKRVAAAMSAFIEEVHYWQRKSGVSADRTTLIGFSQGAIMALEASLLPQRLAGRVVAMAGRFARLPADVRPNAAIHFLHGDRDNVIAAQNSIDAAQRLRGLGTVVTLELIQGLGHGIDDRVMYRLLDLLLASNG
jgi:phospholipase/carboxylesterase